MKAEMGADRITARVPVSVKERLEQAAELSGATSLNQFVISAALKEAEQVLERERVINLDNRTTKLFFELLDNPPKPNKRLKSAIKKYQAELHAHRTAQQGS